MLAMPIWMCTLGDSFSVLGQNLTCAQVHMIARCFVRLAEKLLIGCNLPLPLMLRMVISLKLVGLLVVIRVICWCHIRGVVIRISNNFLLKPLIDSEIISGTLFNESQQKMQIYI